MIDIDSVTLTPNLVVAKGQFKIEVELYALYPGPDLFPGPDTYPGEDPYLIHGTYPGADTFPGADTCPGADTYIYPK